MNFNLVTIFPEITKLLDFGVIGKAIEKDLISMNSLNLRDFSKNTNRNVDDAPYGGGEGVVMMAEPLACLLYTSPSPRDRIASRIPSSA